MIEFAELVFQLSIIFLVASALTALVSITKVVDCGGLKVFRVNLRPQGTLAAATPEANGTVGRARSTVKLYSWTEGNSSMKEVKSLRVGKFLVTRS